MTLKPSLSGLLMLGLLAAGSRTGCRAQDDSPSPWIGKTAPPFALTSTAGKRVQLSDAKKKVVVLSFFASW